MAKLPAFDHWLSEAILHAPSDPEAAAWVLKEVAGYLRRMFECTKGDPVELPSDAARYLADAFEKASRVPAKARPAELARALNLTAPGRRPKAPSFTLALAVLECGGGVNAAIGAVAERFNVDVSTVRRAWREWRSAF
ncbi:hypothetical protein [Dyella agri]|uniref:Uncharacterized protein n=1 Tax=Dyella agri TaxID=1926869 RepID=A0ABW8KB43_9GAMM